MIPTSLHNLMCAVDLLYENEKGERMRHDKVGNPKRLVRNLCKKLQIHAVASTDNEYEVFALISSIFEHFCEVPSIHPFSALIEQYDRSREFLEGFLDDSSFFYLDIFWIRMRNGLERLEIDMFPEAFSIF